MRIKAVSSLVGGEVLAEPILTEKNDILIPNGTRIKPDYVPLIESLGIESVMVEDPYENYESKLASKKAKPKLKLEMIRIISRNL